MAVWPPADGNEALIFGCRSAGVSKEHDAALEVVAKSGAFRLAPLKITPTVNVEQGVVVQGGIGQQDIFRLGGRGQSDGLIERDEEMPQGLRGRRSSPWNSGHQSHDS